MVETINRYSLPVAMKLGFKDGMVFTVMYSKADCHGCRRTLPVLWASLTRELATPEPVDSIYVTNCPECNFHSYQVTTQGKKTSIEALKIVHQHLDDFVKSLNGSSIEPDQVDGQTVIKLRHAA